MNSMMRWNHIDGWCYRFNCTMDNTNDADKADNVVNCLNDDWSGVEVGGDES